MHGRLPQTAAPPEHREPSGGELAEEEAEELGGFGDFFSLDNVPPPDKPTAIVASPGEAATPVQQGTTTVAVALEEEDDAAAAEPGQLPWARASRRIRSPLLRLHNGVRSNMRRGMWLHALSHRMREAWPHNLCGAWASTLLNEWGKCGFGQMWNLKSRGA